MAAMVFMHAWAVDGFRLLLAAADMAGWWGCAALTPPYSAAGWVCGVLMDRHNEQGRFG